MPCKTVQDQEGPPFESLFRSVASKNERRLPSRGLQIMLRAHPLHVLQHPGLIHLSFDFGRANGFKRRSATLGAHISGWVHDGSCRPFRNLGILGRS